MSPTPASAPARTLRVALFHSSLPARGAKPGGVEVHVVRLARHLRRHGHAPVIFTFTPPTEDLGVPVRVIGRPWLARSQVARMVLAPLALNRVTFRGFDVVHLHGDDWFWFRRGVPTVRTFHGSAREEARTARSWRRRWRQRVGIGLEALSARLATARFGVAPPPAAHQRTEGYLPAGVDVGARPNAARRAQAPTVLFVGTLGGRKRGALLEEIFTREVLPVVPDAHLVMVIAESGPTHPRIRRTGVVSDAELTALYDQAWVFCLPSTYEGLGIPYLEAMARGVPVVASPNPGAEHILVGGAGAIAPDETLGRRLAALLGDEATRRALADGGFTRVQEFAWPRMIERHEAAYTAAIARGAA